MYQIHLKDIKLNGKHGVYEAEHLLAAPFLINLTCFLEEKTVIHNLDDTVDYAIVYEIIKKHFGDSHQLLETLAKAIVNEIKMKYAIVKQVEISIYKLNAGIEGLNGKVGITFAN